MLFLQKAWVGAMKYKLASSNASPLTAKVSLTVRSVANDLSRNRYGLQVGVVSNASHYS